MNKSSKVGFCDCCTEDFLLSPDLYKIGENCSNCGSGTIKAHDEDYESTLSYERLCALQQPEVTKQVRDTLKESARLCLEIYNVDGDLVESNFWDCANETDARALYTDAEYLIHNRVTANE